MKKCLHQKETVTAAARRHQNDGTFAGIAVIPTNLATLLTAATVGRFGGGDYIAAIAHAIGQSPRKSVVFCHVHQNFATVDENVIVCVLEQRVYLLLLPHCPDDCRTIENIA